MAKVGTVKDVYPNRAFERLTLSAANTLTFVQLQFGVGLFQGIAAIINRIEWFPPIATIQELLTGADTLEMALTNRDDLANLDPTNQSVLAKKNIIPLQVGAVTSLTHERYPMISDYSTMPGGGLIVPANPLYVGMITTGFAAAAVVDIVVYLLFKQLTDAEYIELVQTIMPANI